MRYDPKHIALLLFKHLAGTLTVEEQRALHEWRYYSTDRDAMVKKVEDEDLLADRARSQLPENFNVVDTRMLSTISAAIGKDFSGVSRETSVSRPRTVHRVQFLKTAWFRYAAAIILMIGIGVAGYFMALNTSRTEVAQRTKSTTEKLANPILPGTNKAILTLSDGRRVELDSGASGTIQDQSLSIKQTNGQLTYGSSGVVVYNTMTTPLGGQYRVVLPDGTQVWLNAASRITYPTAFTGKERKVNVEGEAYFTVAKKSRQPFVVITNNTAITVLGTEFNVNSYANEEAERTTLVSGAVKVTNGKAERILRPGEQAISREQQVQVQPVSVAQVTGWKNGLFNFEGADVPTVMRQLERWYGIKVVYGPNIPAKTFRGELPRKLPFSDILDVMEAVGVKYRLDNQVLYIGE